MDNKQFSINPASGADSTSVQERVVKGSLSSSNLNECEELEEVDLDFHKYDYRSGNPAVFCCTYHKYNEGRSLTGGMWLDLLSFSCYDDFMAACRWLHRDESDPEFMYLDYENFCAAWYCESCMDEDTFDRIQEYAALDEDEQEAFEAFLDITCDKNVSFDDFRERYCGKWDSEREFAEHLCDELDMFHNVPESVSRFFDYAAFARELFLSDYDFSDGYVFRTC
ncbi:MAG: antirestriction protein ArdA [Muribaculaceae bacterium]|nr:antirestriction protein ArdA [Muribaculaceae bacterium]